MPEQTRQVPSLLRRRWKGTAVAAAALTAFGAWFFLRPATLRVDCFPPAEVWLDGVSKGVTPQELSVAPGEHELVLRSGGFAERQERYHLGPGETHELRLILIAADPDNPEALEKLGARFRIAMATLDKAKLHRGAEPGGTLPLFPRGPVRLQDLETYRIDVDRDFNTEGTVEFFTGSRRLFSAPFEPEELTTIAPLPAAVREGLAAGQSVRWGFAPVAGAGIVAEFAVVAGDGVAVQVNELERELKEQDPRLVAHLRANLLLGQKLYYAAYRAAAAQPVSTTGCAVMQKALDGMQVPANARARTELARRVAELDK